MHKSLALVQCCLKCVVKHTRTHTGPQRWNPVSVPLQVNELMLAEFRWRRGLGRLIWADWGVGREGQYVDHVWERSGRILRQTECILTSLPSKLSLHPPA